jgi:hypothetical protein
VKGSLAAMISGIFKSSKTPLAIPTNVASAKLQHSVPGVFTQQSSTRLSILNGNHTTISEHHERGTVLIFPEYRFAFGVENTPKAAELLYEKAISPSTTYIPTIPEEDEAGELPFGILPIPYSCVILLCELFLISFSRAHPHPQGSHKRRDKRCHISAPVLENGTLHHETNRSAFPELTHAPRTHPLITEAPLDS